MTQSSVSARPVIRLRRTALVTAAALSMIATMLSMPASASASAASTSGPSGRASGAQALGAPEGSVFVAVTPCRVVDTRDGGGALAAGATTSFQVSGAGTGFAAQGGTAGGCAVPTAAKAVSASVSAVNPRGNGFLRVWPSGGPAATATFLNFTKNQGITNTGAVALGSGTKDLTTKNFGAISDFVIDVQGYFVDPADLPTGVVGSVFVPVLPCRAADTREAGGPLSNGEMRAYQIAGDGAGFAAQGGKANGCAIPDAATGVSASLSAVDPQGNGFLRAWPSGGPAATATFLNFTKNQSITNTGAFGLGTGPKDLTTRNFGAKSDYVIDVQGYFIALADLPADAVGSTFVAMVPCRVADTREAGGALFNGTVRPFQVAGSGAGFAAQGGKANGCAIPETAAAVEASVSAVDPTGNGFFRAWPSGGSAATATFLNYNKAQSITNTGSVGLGTGPKDLTTQNFGATSHYVIDIQGYYAPMTVLEPVEYDNEVTVALHWQSEYRETESQFGGVDDYAAFHLSNDGVGDVTLKWDDGADTLVTDGQVNLTSRVTPGDVVDGGGLLLHTGASNEEGPAALLLPPPTFVGTGEPDVVDRGLYTYSLDGEVPADAALLADLGSATGSDNWYVNVHTTANPDGEARGQLGVADGGLSKIVPVFKNFEFRELGVGTNTGTDQSSFDLYFDEDIDFPPGDGAKNRPAPADFVMKRTRAGVTEEIDLIRVRGNNPDWQPYPKAEMRVHLDTHEVVKDDDIFEITMKDSAVKKLLPHGRNAGAGDLMDSWRTRCTHLISVAAETSEPCGTPEPQPGLVNSNVTAINSAPNQTQTFSVTIDESGLPADDGEEIDGENELWVDLLPVVEEGLVDYSGSTWTATVGGVEVGTAEFYLDPDVERFGISYEPKLVFRHTAAAPVAGDLVLTGTGIDASDTAVFRTDTTYDTHFVRFDTGRVAYDDIVVNYLAQPWITLEPTDEVYLAEVGADHTTVATHEDADGNPVADADIVFTAKRADGTVIETETVTTDADGKASFTYTYDWPALPVAGAVQVDTVRAVLVDDTFVDSQTTVIWSAGVATNDGPSAAQGKKYHDLNDAVVGAEAGDTITAVGAFSSAYGTPRDDRVSVNKPLTLLGNGEASMVGAFDLRADDVTLDGFEITHGGSKEYAIRAEGKRIEVTNNVIDANGKNAINVRDAWSPIDGGGSALISGNTITDAAIGIHVTVDKKKDGQPVPFLLVVELTITDNTISDSGTGIYWKPDAGSTATISSNTFEAGATSGAYVHDDSRTEDAVALNLTAILAGNVYAPIAEILGTKIMPNDPTHVPTMVRVVEHGAGQGNMYSVVEFSRGIACSTDGAAVGSQFYLDRGEDTKTPNRRGIKAICNYNGDRSMVRIDWDGNPSFPNEITYIEDPDIPPYRIRNEHELVGGGFTEALSPQTVGSPFPKPVNQSPVVGEVAFELDEATIDRRWFTPGQVVTPIDVTAKVANRSVVPATGLKVILEGARPGETDFYDGGTICAELFTAASCTAITDGLAANVGFVDTTTVLDGVTLEFNNTAATGKWQLRWSVVDAATDALYYSDTFTISIIR